MSQPTDKSPESAGSEPHHSPSPSPHPATTPSSWEGAGPDDDLDEQEQQELARVLAKIDEMRERWRTQPHPTRKSIKLRREDDEAMTVERALDLSGQSAQGVHQMQQEYFATIDMANAAALDNAETARALTDSALQQSGYNAKIAASLADAGRDLRELRGGRPAGKSGAEVFGEVGGELLRQLGGVAQCVLGGGGGSLAGLLEGKLGEVLGGMGGPSGVAQQAHDGSASHPVQGNDPGGRGPGTGEGGAAPAPAAVQAPPRAAQPSRSAPVAHPQSEAAAPMAVLIDHLPSEILDQVAQAMKDPQRAAQVADRFLQEVLKGSGTR